MAASGDVNPDTRKPTEVPTADEEGEVAGSALDASSGVRTEVVDDDNTGMVIVLEYDVVLLGLQLPPPKPPPHPDEPSSVLDGEAMVAAVFVVVKIREVACSVGAGRVDEARMVVEELDDVADGDRTEVVVRVALVVLVVLEGSAGVDVFSVVDGEEAGVMAAPAVAAAADTSVVTGAAVVVVSVLVDAAGVVVVTDAVSVVDDVVDDKNEDVAEVNLVVVATAGGGGGCHGQQSPSPIQLHDFSDVII